MRKQLTLRLKELKVEFKNGRKKLAEIEAQSSGLYNTLLRISGAIQVLEEELANEHEDSGEIVSPETNEAAKNGVTADLHKVVNMGS